MILISQHVLDDHLFLAARRPYQEPHVRHDLGRMEVKCRCCGALHWMDEKLCDSSRSNPIFGMCCNSGKVVLPILRDPPQSLKTLLERSDRQGRDFRENIWKYNRAFAFTSLQVTEDHSINERCRGPPVFRIQGELHHRGGPLLPAVDRPPTYAQLYFYDSQAALEYRCHQNSGLNPDTLRTLQDMLLEHHQYASIYRHAYEILERYDPNDDVAIHLRVAPGHDRRRYNLPTADEVAVILPGVDGDNTQVSQRDIVLQNRTGGLQIISDLHPAYVPLYYVLLFPYGENGWHPALTLGSSSDSDTTAKRLTRTRYVAYRLQVRENEYSALLRGGRLLQRFMVDMFASIDQSRLLWFRLNQPTIRACLYSGLEDAAAQGDDEVDLHTLGQRFILPSSYIGGPRHMQQRFQDSMAIARYFGQVDIFMTVTTNPLWPEITRELLPGQTAYDRPDLVSRVFQMKKKAIIDFIYKHGIFGSAVAYVYTIEFQKRGLPHIHILIFLKEPYKLHTAEAIDSCIWARWPDPETQPLLFETIKRCMVHGPCGAANPNSPCMENGKCTKGYPKSFAGFTTMDEHGFPIYFRPDDGCSYSVGGFCVDNRWIVPFCPFLSAAFDCHINVECAASLGSFKYLFKYIQKGPDLASLEINDRDEIKRYTEGRYIGPSEAGHRIHQFDIHGQVPSVVRLQIHLPGQHMVTFDPNENIDTILARASHERTTLSAYFEANANSGELGVEARKYTYQEFPQHFTWKADRKKWSIRRRDSAIGRMYFVPPTAGERFYLRTLLTVVKGAKSFDDLRRYNSDEPHPTFHAACIARGLLEDDGEWNQCLAEASQMQTGTRLRHLFATILLFCTPSQPHQLWQQYRTYICDDLRYRLRTLGINNACDEDVYDYGLYMIDHILHESGHSLGDWPSMPTLRQHWEQYTINDMIAEQLNYDRNVQRAFWESHHQLLNDEQRNAHERILHSVENGVGGMFMIHGHGGTGKTFLYKVICSRLRSEGTIVLCTASSGIAALLLPGGRTAHSMFKIPIDSLSPESVCCIPKNSMRADLMRAVKCIIWDEIVPQHRYAIEALDRTLRDLRDNDEPFGGVTLLIGGDFQQTLPVIPKGSREQILDATVTRSYLWNDIEVIHLHRNMRLRDDPDAEQFAAWLLQIGCGENSDENGKVEIPQEMRSNDIESLMNFVYPDLNSSSSPPPEYFLNRMILAPRNTDVNSVNETLLDRMIGDVKTYYSADQVIREPGADDQSHLPITPEFLRAVKSSSLPPGELRIKIGCPLILMRNLSPSNGLCNGSRMVVVRMSERVLQVQLIGGDHDGQLALIPRISLIPTSTPNFAFKIRRRQFPVRLAFAITINRAQGQSVKHVGLDLRIPVFAHGQLYVALSRVTAKRNIKVLLPHDNQDSKTNNIVYDEALLQ
jgi:hypothetical protein